MANVLIALARDEEVFLVDFVLYHHSIGVERFIIFDDCSRIPVSNVLFELPDLVRNNVEIHLVPKNFPSPEPLQEAKLWDPDIYVDHAASKQAYLYNYVLRHFLGPRDWALFIDLDEFLCLGEYVNLSDLRAAVMARGFCAIVIDMLLYGHSFNLWAPLPVTLSSFIWRSRSYHGHGKIFCAAGALKEIRTPHYPNMYREGLVTDASYRPREQEIVAPSGHSTTTVHIKHFIIQDVYTCFRRRAKSRISSQQPVTASNHSWLDRVRMVNGLNDEQDLTLACEIITRRATHGMEIYNHITSLRDALLRSSPPNKLCAVLDVENIRKNLNLDEKISNADVLFQFFSKEQPDKTWLRFKNLPDDFDPEQYRSIHADLEGLNSRQLRDHYARYGQKEGRSYTT